MQNIAFTTALALAALFPDSGTGGTGDRHQDGEPEVSALLSFNEVHADPVRRIVSLPARVVVRTELLEYLLVGPRGAAHESLFLTEEDPELLNAALLLLGAEPGANAVWTPVDPPPTLEERRAGKPVYDVTPPRGPESSAWFLYAAWREGEEEYFFRVEDLIANLETGRSMRRHPWVFLGSKFLEDGEGGEVFAASADGNLINVSFFREGHTLFTCGLPECLEQSIWVANPWLVPPADQPVLLLMAQEPLAGFPDGWPAEPLAVTVPEPGDTEGDARD